MPDSEEQDDQQEEVPEVPEPDSEPESNERLERAISRMKKDVLRRTDYKEDSLKEMLKDKDQSRQYDDLELLLATPLKKPAKAPNKRIVPSGQAQDSYKPIADEWSFNNGKLSMVFDGEKLFNGGYIKQ